MRKLVIIKLPRGALPPGTPPRGASSAPAGRSRRQIRHLREQRRKMHPSGALGIGVEAVSGPRNSSRECLKQVRAV
eukprot:5668080-Alexandrium_andersonii.AAC.1